jgi:hypothetical protein
MNRIVLVHGMRMMSSPARLHEVWSGALIAGLLETDWGKANPHLVPKPAEIAVVYYADLLRGRLPGTAKGSRAIEAFLRGLVRGCDFLAFWHPDGKPRGPFARLVNHMVWEAALYMQNGRVRSPDPRHPAGAFFQVQARAAAALTEDTRLVIGHSLGATIAFEALCGRVHRVDTLITVGAPIATRRLILEPLKERLHRLLDHPPSAPPPWPGVRHWTNVYSRADVFPVPVTKLAPIFSRRIRDIEVSHGSPRKSHQTHKLTAYLKQRVLCDEIAAALARSDVS